MSLADSILDRFRPVLSPSALLFLEPLVRHGALEGMDRELVCTFAADGALEVVRYQ